MRARALRGSSRSGATPPLGDPLSREPEDRKRTTTPPTLPFSCSPVAGFQPSRLTCSALAAPSSRMSPSDCSCSSSAKASSLDIARAGSVMAVSSTRWSQDDGLDEDDPAVRVRYTDGLVGQDRFLFANHQAVPP